MMLLTMIADVHEYNTRSSEHMNLYLPKCSAKKFLYQGMPCLWNALPDEVKEPGFQDDFKRNYRFFVW